MTKRFFLAAPPQKLTSLVLDVLRRGHAPRAGAWGLRPSEIQRAVDTFVTAGSRALIADAGKASWRAWGVDIELPRHDTRGTPRARALVSSLRRLVVDCQKDRSVSSCFFMRKPPGLRLRIETTAPDRIERKVARWLERQSTAPSPLRYEPEEYQFGGPIGMEIAHRHFSADSLAALDVTAHELAKTSSAPIWAMSLLCIVDLLAKVTGDGWEMWDLWSNLRLTGRLGDASDDEDDLAALASDLEPFVLERSAMRRLLAAPERAIVARYVRANSRAARDLLRAHGAGQLLYGLRQIVPFWIVFHWNRWGLTVDEQRSLAHGVEYLLNPKKKAHPLGK